MELVAVYGTLKQGQYNHPVLGRQGAEYLGTDILTGWVMYDLGSFPCIVPTKLSGSIVVEVYKVADLKATDRLEGYPGFYDRVQVATHYGSAWIYFMREAPQGAELINSGVWE
jgi:gamma-glutamylcyclotransferase (GGCT)/AIG2-like uncharacterized protein YtfP